MLFFLDMAEMECLPSQKKRSFDAAFKLEFAGKNSNRGAGRKFSVEEKSVREWRKHKVELLHLPTKKRWPKKWR